MVGRERGLGRGQGRGLGEGVEPLILLKPSLLIQSSGGLPEFPLANSYLYDL